ncbi:MAG TPA: hypothetical protein VEB86_17295, partial [Chryseosolibacter sp.]|nr:hypothetical protein [Chryseosolibacter sp.]
TDFLCAVCMIIVLITSCTSKTLVITQSGVANIRLGETTLADIKRAYPFARTRKTVKHVLFRAGDRVEGKVFQHASLRVARGITCHFTAPTIRSTTTVDEIVLSHPSGGTTDKGIAIGWSTFAEVDQLYGLVNSDSVDGQWVKDYETIVFYSTDRFVKPANKDQHVVSAIKIRQR